MRVLHCHCIKGIGVRPRFQFNNENRGLTPFSTQSAPARLDCRFVCTTSGFAQKKDANPVGGRGISAFGMIFF